MRGLHYVPYEERLRQLSLEHRRHRADLILAFNIFKGEVDLNPSDFFLRPPRAGLRGHTYRLLQGPSGAFSVRVVKYWNRLPVHLVLSPSVSIFKKQLDRQWSEIFPAAPVLLLCPFSGMVRHLFCNPKLVVFPFPLYYIISLW